MEEQLIPKGILVGNVVPEVNARRMSAMHLAVYLRHIFDKASLEIFLLHHVPIAEKKMDKLQEMTWGLLRNEEDLLFVELRHDLKMLSAMQDLFPAIVNASHGANSNTFEQRILKIRSIMLTPFDLMHRLYRYIDHIVTNMCFLTSGGTRSAYNAVYLLLKCFSAVSATQNSVHFLHCVFGDNGTNTKLATCQWPGCKTRWAAELANCELTLCQFEMALFVSNNMERMKEIAKLIQDCQLDYATCNILVNMLCKRFMRPF